MKQEARNKYVALCGIDVLQDHVQKRTRLSSPVTGLPRIQSSRYQVGVSEMQIPGAERG